MNAKLNIILLTSLLKCFFGMELENHAIADTNGTYHIFWTVNDEVITIEVRVASKGYVGFGISPNGGMPGSDIVIGWVLPNGKAYFQDRYALGFYEPPIDSEQNYKLLNAYENETHTVLRFTRKLNTCDKENDIVITDSTLKIIFSWHPDDPQNITGLPTHGPNRRGSRNIMFISPQPPPFQTTDDIITWDIQVKNLTVPAQRTTYWCFEVKLPTFTIPHYYIGYTVHISPGNENIVHHFAVYECRGNATFNEEKYQQRKDGYECIETGALSDPVDCQPAMIIWAVGAEGQFLPDGIGIPLGEEYGGPSYFLIEMHYNNIEMKSGMVDSSTLRLYLSKKNTTKKANMLQMYANFDYSLLIPPQQPEFQVTTYCPSECTSKAFPEEGITLFAVGLHAHLSGRKLSVRHFRDGKELKPIVTDNSYNFNYQEVRNLPKPVQILPGDLLMGTCVYSTMDRNETVVGGYGTYEEMCFFYLYYYPVIDLTICIGGPNYKDIFDYFGAEEVASDYVHIISPESLRNQSMFDRIKYYDWAKVNDTMMKKMSTMQYEGVKNFTCQNDPTRKDTFTSVLIEYPTDIPPYVPADLCDFSNSTIQKQEVEYI